jgi:serine/threonine-protein kinase HipA
MPACWACLREAPAGARYHPGCLRGLFGSAKVPVVDVELARLHTLALAMVGHTSLSGVQRKISLSLEAESRTLRVAADGGHFILKPQAQSFPFLPENEHATMRLAARVGIDVPPCALVELKDGSRAYIVRRFDRPTTGGKLLQEDFCQLAVKSPKEKYSGSAELCAKLLLRYASAPVIEAQRLFRLLVFVWWTGNGDMHLKNFSLLRHADGQYRLSPAYDLLATRLVITDDELALPIGGTPKHISRRKWLELATRCKLPETAAVRVLTEIGESVDEATELIGASLLPDAMKRAYEALVRTRARALLPRRPG